LFAEAGTLFAKTNKFLKKVDSVLDEIHYNVQDYRSWDGVCNFKEALKYLNKAAVAFEQSRERFGETKIFILSVEMIDELMKYLSFRDKKTLRLVSRSMYDLVTPHDRRFYTWNIDLNRGCSVKLGRIFDRCPDAKLHITLHKSESVMAKFMNSYTHDLTKASDRIVELVATSPVIRKMPDAFKMMDQLEKLSISYVKLDDENTTRLRKMYGNDLHMFPPIPDQDYNDVMPILQRNSNSLTCLYLLHFHADKVNSTADFKLKALKDLQLSNYHGELNIASDVIGSKCKDSLETLTLFEVSLGDLKVKKSEEIPTLATLKELTVTEKSNTIMWSLPDFLTYVCPGVTKLVLNSVHIPIKVFEGQLVIEELYIHNCRIDTISSLLNACSLTLTTLHIQQDRRFRDKKLYLVESDLPYMQSMMDGHFCIIKRMLTKEFRLRNLQNLTLVTHKYDDADEMTKAFGNKLPAGVNILIKRPRYKDCEWARCNGSECECEWTDDTDSEWTDYEGSEDESSHSEWSD